MSASRRRAAALLGVVALAAAALAATTTSRGGDDEPVAAGPPAASTEVPEDPRALLEAARAAARSATSVRVTGSSDELEGDFQVDVRSLPQEHRCHGTMTGHGVRMEFVLDDRTAYIRGNQKFWRLAAKQEDVDDLDAVLRYLGDKWVAGEVGRRERQIFAPLCETERFLAPSDRTDPEMSGREHVGAITARRVRFAYLDQDAVVGIDQDDPHRLLDVELVNRRSGYITTSLSFAYDGKVTVTVPDAEDTITKEGPVLGA